MAMQKILIPMLLFAFNAYATAPEWKVQEGNYAYTMTVTGKLFVNGKQSVATADKFAAFAGNECRAVASPHYTSTANDYIYFLNIYGNTTGEPLVFRYYSATGDSIVTISQSFEFQVDRNIGSSLGIRDRTYPALNSNSAILSFSVSGEYKSAQIADSTITIYMPWGTDISNAQPLFTAPMLAEVYIENEIQKSGINTIDLTKPTIYTCISSDKSDTSTFSVVVDWKLPELNLSPIAITELSNIGDTVTTILPDQNASGAFELAIRAGDTANIFTIDANSGTITLAKPLDYETEQSYLLEIAITDGINATIHNVKILVQNENDSEPMLISKTFALSETDTAETIVGHLEIADADGDSSFVYTIVGGNNQASFSIIDTTGILSLNKMVDYETVQFFSLIISVDDGSNTMIDSISISIVDSNDEHPVLSDTSCNISDATTIGTAIVLLSATDADTHGLLRYFLLNQTDAFRLDTLSGLLTLTEELDHTTKKQYTLYCMVSDSIHTDTAEITIIVTDSKDDLTYLIQDTTVLSESATEGIVLDTLRFTTKNPDPLPQFEILDGNVGNIFAVNNSTGTISITKSLDYESRTGYRLVIAIKDGAHTTLGIKTYLVTNENDVMPEILSDKFAFAEDAEAGSIIGQMQIFDIDSDTIFTFSLSESPLFQIDSVGKIRLKGMADYETDSVHTVSVSVSDGRYTAKKDINISVHNINDEYPVLNNFSASIAERAQAGTVLGSLSATDADKIEKLQYKLVGSDTISVDPETGILTLLHSLDFERQQTISCQAVVSDGLHSDTASVLLSITDVNDESPQVIPDTLTISENATVGEPFYTIAVADPDGENNFSYAIKSGNTGNYLSINPITGALYLNKKADYEDISRIDLEIIVSDGTNIGNGTIVIHISDENDEVPVVEDYFVYLQENTKPSTEITQFKATDVESTKNLRYSIISGNINTSFELDEQTGILHVAQQIDYESTPEFNLYLSVSDGLLQSYFKCKILVTDVNEPPAIKNSSSTLHENPVYGTEVATISISDADINNSNLYAITGGNDNGAFAIDPKTGIISIKKGELIDYETKKSIELTITVSDAFTDSLSASAIHSVTVVNVNEAPQIFPLECEVAEDAQAFTEIGTIEYSDPDDDQNLSFAITAGNEDSLFSISTDGVLSVSKSAKFDFETNDLYQLQVTVRDDGSPSLSASTDITVAISDVAGDEIVASNLITPNNDGKNDTWQIQTIENYQQCHFYIFDSYGNTMLDQLGYSNNWDGTHNGKTLPNGTYFYKINCYTSGSVHEGFITIMR